MKSIVEIFLSNGELSALRAVDRDHTIRYEIALCLEDVGLVTIKRYIPHRSRALCEITRNGRRYLDLQNRKSANIRWNYAFNILTILISIGSLIISIIALRRS